MQNTMKELRLEEQIFKYFRYESKKGSVIHKKGIDRSLLVPYFPITRHYNFWDKLSLSNRDFMTTYSAIMPQDSPFLKQFKKFFDLSNRFKMPHQRICS